jgi:hypothetical protein
MSRDVEHIALANRNQEALAYLLAAPSPFFEWVSITAFYKAMHIVEAVFFNHEAPPTQHTVTHSDRNHILKIRYPNLLRNYRPLFNASLVARYLAYEDMSIDQQYTSFSQYMPANVVRSLLLGHYLVQPEANALPLLPANPGLITYTAVAPPAPIAASTTTATPAP